MLCCNEKDVIVTLGNEFRSDDAAGVLFGRLVSGHVAVPVIKGGDAPENITGLIVREKPGRIIIVDTLDFGANPGDTICIPAASLAGSGTSTHGALSFFVEYIENITAAPVLIIGFQPLSLAMGEKISSVVHDSVIRMAEDLIETGNFTCRSEHPIPQREKSDEQKKTHHGCR